VIKILENLKIFDHKEVLDRFSSISSSKDIEGVILDTRPFDVDKYPCLKVISRVGVGVDNIDLEKCSRKGIVVLITPCDELITSVAEHTVYLMFSILRRNANGHTLRNKRVLIIGYGRIGSAVDILLTKLGCEVDTYDICYADHDLLGQLPYADIISIHVSGRPLIIDKDTIKYVKNTSYIINTARQGCVDIAVVSKALREGLLAGYASDVDLISDAVKYSLPIKKCVLTEHTASSTVEARAAMESMAIENLINALK